MYMKKCVICDTIIPISEERCSNCGWRYTKDTSLDYEDGNSITTTYKDIALKTMQEAEDFEYPDVDIDVYLEERKAPIRTKPSFVLKIVVFILALYWLVLLIRLAIKSTINSFG